MTRTTGWWVSILALALASCYDPTIKEGGFLCGTGDSCPEGFSCVQEGPLRVCRSGGAPSPDSGTPDAARDATPDLRPKDAAPDADTGTKTDAKTDTKTDTKTDGPSGDGPTPACNMTDVPVSQIKLLDNGYDLAMSAVGVPHAVFIDKAAGAVKQAQLIATPTVDGPSWEPTAAGVAAALDSNGRLHVLYVTGQNTADSAYLVSRSPTGWVTKSFKLQTGGWNGLDLAADGTTLYGALAGNDSASTPLAQGFTANYGSAGNYNVSSVTCKGLTGGSKFTFARVAAGSFGRGFTTHWDKTGAEGQYAYNTKTCQQQWVAAVKAPAPMAIAVSSSLFQLAYVSDIKTLYRALWNGSSMPSSTTAATTVEPQSVDIAVDLKGRSHLVYRKASAQNVRWTYFNGTKWIDSAISNAKGAEARIALYNSTAYFLYEDTATQQLKWACRTF